MHRETEGFDGLVQSSGVPLPPVFWGQAISGLRCLDHTIETVWREGYSHHITRLMVLGNLATLLDLDARELSDWFWVAYTDAYDWVVRDDCGAVVLFSGTTRDHAEGRDGVTSLTYEAYAEEIDGTFAEIVGEIRRRWPTTGRVVMWHRVGTLGLGESIE